MKKIRSAIYTRKSAEEGLEQEFNCAVILDRLIDAAGVVCGVSSGR